MRRAEAAHWVRFHSLPESKRYPDGEAEWQVVLGRMTALAEAALGEEASCWLSTHLFVTLDGEPPSSVTLPCLPEPAPLALTVFDLDDGEAERFAIYAAAVTWGRDRFDPLLRAVACWEDSAMWTSQATGAVFAPYDGGADLFLPDAEARADLKARYSEWLSPHPSGL